MNQQNYAKLQEKTRYSENHIMRINPTEGLFPDIDLFRRIPEKIKSFRDLENLSERRN